MQESAVEPPFHAFEGGGFYLALDRFIPAYLEIDRLADEALCMFERGIPEHIVQQKLVRDWGAARVTNMFASLKALQRKGFFARRGSPPVMGGARTIERLVHSRTGRIQLALAESCNLRCKYCYVHPESKWRHQNERIMPWEVAREAIDLLLQRAGTIDDLSITLFGGEPLLNKEALHQVIAYTEARKKELCKDKKTFYSLTTNGILMSHDVIREIKRHNFGLMISMDGPATVHDAVRVFLNHRGSWRATARGAMELMKFRRQVSVRCTITKQCLEKARIVQYLEDFGFHHIRASLAVGQAYEKGPLDVGPDEFQILNKEDKVLEARYIESILSGDWANHRFARFRQALMDVREPKRQAMRCGVGRGTTVVDTKGDLYPCHRYLGMTAYRLGNVNTGIVPELFVTYLEKLFALRRRLCINCWANTLCLGPCPYYVSHSSGDMVDPEPWYCDRIRKSIEDNAAFHSRVRHDYPDYYQYVLQTHISHGQPRARLRLRLGSDRGLSDQVDSEPPDTEEPIASADSTGSDLSVHED